MIQMIQLYEKQETRHDDVLVVLYLHGNRMPSLETGK